MNAADYLVGTDVLGASDQVDNFADAFRNKKAKPGVESAKAKKQDAADAHRVLTASMVAGAVGVALFGGAGALLVPKHRLIAAAIGAVIGWPVGAGVGTAIGVETV